MLKFYWNIFTKSNRPESKYWLKFFFINRNDTNKSDRFKSYLKKFYDYLKINESLLNDVSGGTTKVTATTNESLPELIIDTKLVDNEQIYQQLQLM